MRFPICKPGGRRGGLILFLLACVGPPGVGCSRGLVGAVTVEGRPSGRETESRAIASPPATGRITGVVRQVGGGAVSKRGIVHQMHYPGGEAVVGKSPHRCPGTLYTGGI